jgi:hypothetical protein
VRGRAAAQRGARGCAPRCQFKSPFHHPLLNTYTLHRAPPSCLASRRFSYPVVPKGMARIRTQISAGHSEADIDAAIQAFKEVGLARGVIKA